MILGFDTATDWLTIAVGGAGTLVAELNEEAPKSHLSRLLPAIRALLAGEEIGLPEIEHIAVGLGPGSFTGSRIGVAVAQGLAHALKIPLVGVSTLDVIGAGVEAEPDRIIYSVIDAKRRELFAAGYDHQGRLLSDYAVLTAEALVDQLKAADRPVVLAGDGLVNYHASFERLGGLATLAPPDQWAPKARVLIPLAEEKITKGQVGPYFNVLPIYIRLPDAEEAVKRVRSR
jgi:tRNA threonylcarbamoyladenosine biosynthesis protein TsaB